MKPLIVACLLLLASPVHAQQLWSNHFAGLPSWKSLEFYPDPTFGTGANGAKDNKCQVTTNTNASGANLVVFTCFAVPVPTANGGAWGSMMRFNSWSGHVQPSTYWPGWEIGAEGERNMTTFVPTRNDFYLWDLRRGKTVLYGNSMTEIFSFHDAVWMERYLDVPAGAHLGSLNVGPDWNRGYTGPTSPGGGCPTRFVEGLCVQ